MFKIIKSPLIALLFAAFVAQAHAQTNQQATQTIPLYPGWNLISIQVADPETGVLSIPQFLESIVAYPGPVSAVDNPDYWNDYVQYHPILEIWTYEGRSTDGESDFTTDSQMEESFYDPITASFRRSDLWRSFHTRRMEWSVALADNLNELRPNKAYWVRSFTRIDCHISGKLVGGDTTIAAGWNFVGFNLAPGSELVTLSSILGESNIPNVSQVWGFDAATGAFVGYDPNSSPPTNSLAGVAPGMGYWVLADRSFLLSSEPQILLPGDIDESPLSQEEAFGLGFDRYTGPASRQTLYQNAGFVKFVLDSAEVAAGEDITDDEDYRHDLNQNGIIDSTLTQDTLYFPAGVDRQYITFTRGNGPSYTWTVSSAVPWLRFAQDSGVVTGAQDTLMLTVDRSGLSAGEYGIGNTAQLQITTSNGTSKTVNVLMDVPTVAGDWFGYATLNKVNGKSIPLGKVDLFLNSTMEANSSNRFTTVLNSDRSLLFPRDVFMNGVFYTGQQFSLTTNFSMAEGDINAPGYETFANAPQVPGQVSDYDQDGDGIVDNMNPFPYRLNREVTLQGTRYQSKYMRLDEDDDALTLVPDDRLEGTYVETIRGLLPSETPIYIEGSFVLEREEASYEATKTTAAVLTNTLGQNIGGSAVTSFSDTITLDAIVNVDGDIEVVVDLTFPVPSGYAGTALTLVDADGNEYLLQQGENQLLNGGRYFLDDFDGTSVTGDWTLRVDWDTAERGTLASWSIDIKGTTSHALSGVIHSGTDSSATIQDAWVMLSGTNIMQNVNTSSTGSFDLSQLNENKYKLFIWTPNHQPTTVSFVLDESGAVSQIHSPEAAVVDYANGTFSIGLQHLNPSYPAGKDFEVVAGATLNEGPGNVFYARVPDNFMGGNALTQIYWVIYKLDLGSDLEDSADDSWKFRYFSGNRPIKTINEARIAFDYDFTAGVYRVIASIVDETDARANSFVSTLGGATHPSDDRFTITKQSHSGTSAALELTHWAYLGSLAGRTDGGTGVLAVSGNTLYQESKPDSAAFDIDRLPRSPNKLGPEDTNHWYPGVQGAPLAQQYQTNNNPALLRCVARMGFPAFSASPAAAGNFKIHPGWIDPQ